MDFDSDPETDASVSSDEDNDEYTFRTNSRITSRRSKSKSTPNRVVYKLQIKRRDGKKYVLRKLMHLLPLYRRGGIQPTLSIDHYNNLKHSAYLLTKIVVAAEAKFTGDYGCINKIWLPEDDGTPKIEATHYVPYCHTTSVTVYGMWCGYYSDWIIPIVHIHSTGMLASSGGTRSIFGVELKADQFYLIGGIGDLEHLS